jgi:hypothetical protein
VTELRISNRAADHSPGAYRLSLRKEREWTPPMDLAAQAANRIHAPDILAAVADQRTPPT